MLLPSVGSRRTRTIVRASVRAIGTVTMLAAVAAGCTSRESAADRAPTVANNVPSVAAEIEGTQAPADPPESLASRLAAIDSAVRRWRQAPNLRTAHAAAEEARNLIVGPAGPFYGDADKNGTVAGASGIGLLPGLAGGASLATADHGPCIARDVLGGSWANPARRWSVLEAAIERWTPSNNSFPALPSHAQRIVGWASLTLAAGNVVLAREYGGHARLHSDVAKAALTDCHA